MTNNKKWLIGGGVLLVLLAVGSAIALNQGNLFSGNLQATQLIQKPLLNSSTTPLSIGTPTVTCSASPSPAYHNEDVTWSAKLSNVVNPQGLQFLWSGPEIENTVTANTVVVQYPQIDVRGIVQVTARYWPSGAKTSLIPATLVSGECQVDLTDKPQPAAALGAFCQSSTLSPVVGDSIAFTGTVTGGKAPYTYSWAGPEASGTTQNINVVYKEADIGTQNATFTVKDSANQTAMSQCRVAVKPIATKAINPALSAKCSASNSSPLVGEKVTLTAEVRGGAAPYTYAWKGAEVDGGTSQIVYPIYKDSEVGAQTATFAVVDSANKAASSTCNLTVAAATSSSAQQTQTSTPAKTTTPTKTTTSTTASCTGFTDINGSDSDCAAIGYVRSIGAITGNPDGSFNPSGLIQRDQIAKIALETFGLYDENGAYCSGGTTGFPDVTLRDWSYQYVCRAKDLGVITGYLSGPDKGTFKPSTYLNRAEFLAIILRNLSDKLNNGTSYSDVGLNDWFSSYASFAYNNNLYPGNMLYPETSVTRREAAEILYKLHQLGKI